MEFDKECRPGMQKIDGTSKIQIFIDITFPCTQIALLVHPANLKFHLTVKFLSNSGSSFYHTETTQAKSHYTNKFTDSTNKSVHHFIREIIKLTMLAVMNITGFVWGILT